MSQYQYNDLIIEVLNEPTYKFDSTDNSFDYNKCYFGNDGQKRPISKHGIKVYQNDRIIDSCIIIGSGGATGIQKKSSLIDNNNLLICCCNTVFCLMLPDLDLKWQTQVDPATCFQIFKWQEDYIIHGELQITKLDKNGNKKWDFNGADIFVSVGDEEGFKLECDGILLTDFSNAKYKIDFDGKLLWDTHQ